MKIFIKPGRILLALFSLLVAIGVAPAAIRYVDLNSPSPTPPFTSWATAATNIQDAVDAAVAGDQILVTNGVYETGGRVAPGIRGTTNRVLVLKAVAVQSVNGPLLTTIRGYQVPGTTNGPSAVRCAFLDNLASLSGFTLTNGGTVSDYNGNVGGGVCGGTVSNCVMTGNYAGLGGGAYGSTLYNCAVVANAADFSGGGTSASTLINCVVGGNVVRDSGGGAGGGTLYGCSLFTNSAGSFGGGAMSATLNNCKLIGNSSSLGGAAEECTLNNCLVTHNLGDAAAVSACLLNNCTVVSNSVPGAENSTLVNCIAYYNTGQNYDDLLSTIDHSCTTPAPPDGVGNITNAPLFIDLAGGDLHLQPNSPCIDAGTNLSGIVTNDLDGRPRPLDGNADGAAAFDMGAYEHAVLFVWQYSPNPAPPYFTWSTAATNIQDAVDAALAGDQILVTNGVYQTGGRSRARVQFPFFRVAVQSINGPQFTFIDGGGTGRCANLHAGFLSGFTLTNGGLSAPTSLQGGGASGGTLSNCVLTGNSSPLGGGAASSTLVDCTLIGNSASSNGGAAYSCTLSNCTLVNNTASVDGGGVCFCNLSNCLLTNNSASSNGGGAFSFPFNVLDRCTFLGNVADNGGGAYGGALTNCVLTGNIAGHWAGEYGPSGGGVSHAVLCNCTLENNVAVTYGGGAHACTLDHSTLSGNRIDDRFTSAGSGGGACDSELRYCTLTANSASYGGGAAFGDLYNCLVTANSAVNGGGVYDGYDLINCTIVGNNSMTNIYGNSGTGGVSGGWLYNCIVYYNTNQSGWFLDNYDIFARFQQCCTFPWPGAFPDTNGNIITPPQFVEPSGWSNLRLQSGSPCINTGNNAVVTGSVDLDGRPRIVSGAVDVGAYEFQPGVSGDFIGWLAGYGLPTNGSADYADADNDGMNNWQEWIAGTSPTDSSSALRLLQPIRGVSGVTLTWESVTNRIYFLERTSSIGAQPSFSPLADNIVGQDGTTSYVDTNTFGSSTFFYRVRVK